MNFVKTWLIEKGGTSLMKALFEKISGYKTYVLAIVGAIAAIVSHFWGPMNIGSIPLEKVSTDDMWKAIWAVASLASMRHAIEKKEPADPEKPQ